MKAVIKIAAAAVLAASFLFTACAAKPDDTPIDTVRTEAVTDAGQSDTTDAPAEPLLLETPAGAVLVGKIRKDAAGWYFEPEQPLTVKLTCYPDFTPCYEALTRINMFENSDDGTNKELYRDDTVTISGMLQNYRNDMESLYLYPCKIERGKTTATAYAMPDLDYPEPVQASYDPSLPLPSGMQPLAENGHYVYNPYILTENTLEYMGNDFAVFYKGFVDAWLSYETSCPCTDKNYAEMFSTVLYYEFPLFTADGEFDLQKDYNEQTQTLSWRYKSKSRAEHDKLIADFTAEANSFLQTVKASDSEQLRAQAIYHAFCSRMTYDYDIMYTRERIEAYYAYSLHRGICVTFANAMSQLYAQVGVKATVATGDTANGDGHAWNLVTIDGTNYFCDSTYELSQNAGNGYAYFGMTMQDRLDDGSGFSANTIIIGSMNIKTAEQVTLAEHSLQIQ